MEFSFWRIYVHLSGCWRAGQGETFNNLQLGLIYAKPAQLHFLGGNISTPARKS